MTRVTFYDSYFLCLAMKNLKLYIILVIILIIVIGGVAVFMGFSLNNRSQETRVNVQIDRTVIVQRIQELSRLETVEMVIQRDLTIELNAAGLSFYGRELLQDKATTEYAVTGFVVAGVDLSTLNQDQVILDNEKRILTLNLNSPKILSIQLDEEKTKITSQDFTFLFNVRNLDQNRRREMQDELQRQVIKQSREALKDGACNDDILNKAGENAKVAIKNLFLFSNLEDVVVNINTPQNCEFQLV